MRKGAFSKIIFNLMAPESGVLVLGEGSNDFIGLGVISTDYFVCT